MALPPATIPAITAAPLQPSSAAPAGDNVAARSVKIRGGFVNLVTTPSGTQLRLTPKPEGALIGAGDLTPEESSFLSNFAEELALLARSPLDEARSALQPGF